MDVCVFFADADEWRGNEEAKNNRPVCVPPFHFSHISRDSWSDSPCQTLTRIGRVFTFLFTYLKRSTFFLSFVLSPRQNQHGHFCKWVKISGNFLHEAELLLDWAAAAAAAVRAINEGRNHWRLPIHAFHRRRLSCRVGDAFSTSSAFLCTVGGEQHFWYELFL